MAHLPRRHSAVTLELPAKLTSPSESRRAVHATLTRWGLPQLADDAELLASELVANAVEHGAGPVSLTLRRDRAGCTCEVTVTTPVTAQPPGEDAERGRGLPIVGALAESAGTRHTAWFTLALPGSRSAA